MTNENETKVSQENFWVVRMILDLIRSLVSR